MEFIIGLLVTFLFVYVVMWFISYNDAIKFIELSKHLDAIQYVDYINADKTIRYVIFNNSGAKILNICKTPTNIFIFDYISNESAIDICLPCVFTMCKINKKLLSITPKDVLKDYNSKPVKKTFKDEL